MWNPPSAERLQRVPRLYATEHISAKEKLIHLHFFFGACDWYVAEYDGDDLFFGYAVLNGDMQNSEWGYFTFSELKDISIYGLVWASSKTQERAPKTYEGPACKRYWIWLAARRWMP